MKPDHQIDPPRESLHADDQTIIELKLSDITLPEGKPGLLERPLRVRHLEIGPDGVVEYHAHANRPAIMYVLEGEMVEYNSAHPEPRVLKAPAAIAEHGPVHHYWRNLSGKKVVIIAVDLYDPSDEESDNPHCC